MKCQALFSPKNEINFRMLSASICLVLYGLTIAQILIILGLSTKIDKNTKPQINK